MATEDWAANALQSMPALAPARQTPRVSESRRRDGQASHTWEGQLLCPVKAGLGGGHRCCDKQFLVIFLDAVPLTHGYGSRAVSLPLSFRLVSLLHSEPEGGMLSSSSPSLFWWHGTDRPSSANRRRIRTLIAGKASKIHQLTHCTVSQRRVEGDLPRVTMN